MNTKETILEKPWLNLYADEVPESVDFEELTIPQALIRSAKNHPDLSAYYFYGTNTSYANLWSLVNRTAQAFASIGMKKGDYVTILLPDIPQLPIANFAVQLLGAVCVMNNPLYEKEDLAIQIKEVKPKFIIVFDLLFPKVKDLRKEDFIEEIIVCHVNDLFPIPVQALPKGAYLEVPIQSKMKSFKDLIEAFPNFDENLKDQSAWNEPAVLMYTGGTTGLSKAVILNHSNISQNIQQTRAFLGNNLEEGKERMLAVFPFFHAAGYVLVLSFAPFYALSIALVPRRNPEEILSPYLEVLNQYKPTYFYSIPTAVNELMNMEDLHQVDLSSIKVYGMGDAPIPLAAYKKLKETHPEAGIFKAYGQTEITALGVATPLNLSPRLGSSGIPIPNMNIKVVDLRDDSQEMPPNQIGEILIQCPQIMQGYFNNAEKTTKVLKNGWVYSEDVGYMDEEGWLYILDRKEDMIYKNGNYISPQVIDQHLFHHPNILEASAVGIFPDDNSNTMQIIVFIVLRTKESSTLSEILKYCQQELETEYIPDKIEFVEQLPKSTIGKILRRDLRKEAQKIWNKK